MSPNDDLFRQADYARTIFEMVPIPILVVDRDVQILDCNPAASGLLGADKVQTSLRRGGEVLHCIHSTEAPGGCGHAEACLTCPVRQSVNAAFAGQKVHRLKARMDLTQGGATQTVQMLVTTTPFAYQGSHLVLLMLENVTELLALRSLLPICAQCKKIRNDEQYWESVDSYFRSLLSVEFSHGLCPDCAQEMRRKL
jgi:PAS domain-containing protein